jgi:hypothetical protein
MFGLDHETIWRLFNVVTLSLAALLVLRGAVRRWRAWTARMRLLFQALVLLLFTLIVASIESITEGAPLGVRTFLTTVAGAWIIWATTITPHGYERRERDDDDG